MKGPRSFQDEEGRLDGRCSVRRSLWHGVVGWGDPTGGTEFNICKGKVPVKRFCGPGAGGGRRACGGFSILHTSIHIRSQHGQVSCGWSRLVYTCWRGNGCHARFTERACPLMDSWRAHSHLEGAILTGSLKPRECPVEQDLAERLGMSRTPIREGSGRLVMRGIPGEVPRPADPARDHPCRGHGRSRPWPRRWDRRRDGRRPTSPANMPSRREG
jgi:hypothetical protein